MAFSIPVEMQPLLLAAFFMLALAGWLLWLDIGKTVNRVFAALLTLRALGFLVPVARSMITADGGDVYGITLVSRIIIFPLLPLSIYFLCVYPRRRWLATWRYGGLSMVVLGLLMVVWYALDPSAYGTMRPGVRNPFNGAAPGLIIDPLGPLFIVNNLRVLVWAIIGLVLAWDYVHAKQGASRNAIFLVMLAFILNSLNDVSREIYQRIDQWDAWIGLDMLPWTWAPAFMPFIAAIPVLASIGIVAWFGLRHPDAGPRKVAAGFLVACSAPILSTLIVEGGLRLPLVDQETLMIFVLSIWRLALPVLVTYALLRYSLFSLDIKLKLGVRRSIMVGMFGLTFFIVSEATESLVLAGGGTVFGLMAAGVLSTANRPLERFAGGAADRMMPSTKPLELLTSTEKHALYRHQMELVMQDKNVSGKERRMLDRLADALSFTKEEKTALEDGTLIEVEDEPAPTQPAKARGSLVVRTTIVALLAAAIFGVISQVIEDLIPMTNQQAGLLTSGIVALLLSRIEDLAARLSGTAAGVSVKQVDTMRAALVEAWSDGSLSAKDRKYLGDLETELGILPGQRLRIERSVKRQLGINRRRTA